MPKTPTLGQSTPAALAKQQAATEALTEAEALARAALAVARHVGGGDCHPARARRLATALGRARRAVEVALVQVDHLPPRPRARRAPADAAPAE